MIRIGLISDTHGWLDPRAQEHFASCDEIWHAGDIGGAHVSDELAKWKPLRAVYGNIDGGPARKTFPEHHRFTLDGVKVWMTHIGGRPPGYDRSVLPELRVDSPDLFICGHSHILVVQFDEKLKCLYMNPGAAGRHGWHQMRTVLRFSLDHGKIYWRWWSWGSAVHDPSQQSIVEYHRSELLRSLKEPGSFEP